MNAQSNEERLARLEVAFEHVATKEDLLALKGELKGDIQNLRAELQRTIFWAIGFSVTFMTAVIALATAAQIIVK